MKRKRNPVSEIVVLSNPRGRGRHRRKTHYRRRNPSFSGIFGGVVPMLKEGALGAAGALANDVAFGYGKKFLPDALQSGYGRAGAKLGFAVVLGMALNRVFPGKGRALAAGAATVTIHEVLVSLANQQLPALPLGAYEDNLLGFDSSAPRVGEYMNTRGVGEYMNSRAGVGDLLEP